MVAVIPGDFNALRSLGASLHDADLDSFTSSRTDRTATIQVRIGHLGDEAGRGAKFSFVLQSVRAIDMMRLQPWAVSDREAEDLELIGHRDWGRMIGTDAANLSGPDLRIEDADVQTFDASQMVWPKIFGKPDARLQLFVIDVDGLSTEHGWFSLAIVFETITVSRDGVPITLDAFADLGDAYWERWAARNGQNSVD